MRIAHVVALSATFLAGAVAAVQADPIETTAALTLNALDGHHAINGADSRIDFVPLPLAELTVRHGPDALHIEGLPPVAFSYVSGSGIGRTTTRLSIVNGTYRRTLAGGVWAGIGETVYNQHTTYSNAAGSLYRRFTPTANGTISTTYVIEGQEEQYSRITGMRFELGKSFHARTSTIEASAAFNPRMHGIQYTFIPVGPGVAGGSPTFADAEHPSQVDFAVRVAHRAGPGELLYGLRYLHYSANYIDEPGQLADTNAGIALVVGYRLRL